LVLRLVRWEGLPGTREVLREAIARDDGQTRHTKDQALENREGRLP